MRVKVLRGKDEETQTERRRDGATESRVSVEAQRKGGKIEEGRVSVGVEGRVWVRREEKANGEPVSLYLYRFTCIALPVSLVDTGKVIQVKGYR